MLAREALLFGPGIGLSLGSKSAYLGAGGQVHAPVNVRGGPLLLELFTGRIAGFGGLRAHLAGPLHFEAASSLAVELTQVRTTARDTSSAVSEPRYLAFDPLIGVALGPALRFERWQVALLAGLNVNLLDVRYVFDDAGAERTLFRPWSARPMLSLDLSTSL
jgi:hypothetical protein